MNDVADNKMTRKEWEEIVDREKQFAYLRQKEMARKCDLIDVELDTALADYIRRLDSNDKGDALSRFDAALKKLRSIYVEYECDWDRYISDIHLFRRW